MAELHRGTKATQEFYDQEGWHSQEGKLVDQQLFGVREDGPIRIAMHRRRLDRIMSRLKTVGSQLRFAELGCGGSPELELRPLWEHYTGVDFSAQGLKVTGEKLLSLSVEHALVEADITKLPLDDEQFDAVYCSQVLYHIDTAAGQEAALNEAMRILKKSGLGVFVLANPYPLMFPIRLGKRLLATTFGLKGGGPLPYLPLSLGWYRKVLRRYGPVEIEGYAMASTWFNQKVSEFRMPGRLAWQVLCGIEQRFPRLSAKLGNYFVIYARKQ